MSAINNNSILPPATLSQQPLSLQECKALYTELQPKGGPQIIYTSEQFQRTDSLLNRIKAISSGQQAFNVYGDWFLRFQAVYVKYCASPSASQVQSVVKNLVDNGQLDTAMQLAYRFKGSWVDQFRFMAMVASKITSFADVEKIVSSFTQEEQVGVRQELARELSISNGKQPYHMQFPAADLLRFPGDDSHFGRLTKYYLSISRPDLAKQAFDCIGDESKRDVLLKYTISISHPDLIGTVFPQTPPEFFLNRYQPPKLAVVLPIGSNVDPVVAATPQFDNYRVAKGYFTHPQLQGADPVLSGVSKSPADLLMDALGGARTPEALRQHILRADPNGVIEFSAGGVSGRVQIPVGDTMYRIPVPDLVKIYGANTYTISYKELRDALKSQKIYTAQELPSRFYNGLKQALLADGLVELPNVKLKDLNTPTCKRYLSAVAENPSAYGFDHAPAQQSLFNLSLNQIGAMVVKSEDCHLLANTEGKIFNRQTDSNDAIRLVTVAGIRNMGNTHAEVSNNTAIMRMTFSTALEAAERDFVIFPAQEGDSELHWEALLTAIAHKGANFDTIFVSGNEFERILNERKKISATNPKALANLAKIKIVQGTDLAQLAHNLKQSFPGKTVSLVDPSSPDITLGNQKSKKPLMTNGLGLESADPNRFKHVAY